MLNTQQTVHNFLQRMMIIGSFALGCMIFCTGTAFAAIVPNVEGMTYDLAEETLNQNNLENKTVKDNGKDVKIVVESNWRVIAQSPEAGKEVKDGSTITLTVEKYSKKDDTVTALDVLNKSSDKPKTSVVDNILSIIPDGEYSAVIFTDFGDIPLTVVIKDGKISGFDVEGMVYSLVDNALDNLDFLSDSSRDEVDTILDTVGDILKLVNY